MTLGLTLNQSTKLEALDRCILLLSFPVLFHICIVAVWTTPLHASWRPFLILLKTFAVSCSHASHPFIGELRWLQQPASMQILTEHSSAQRESHFRPSKPYGSWSAICQKTNTQPPFHFLKQSSLTMVWNSLQLPRDMGCQCNERGSRTTIRVPLSLHKCRIRSIIYTISHGRPEPVRKCSLIDARSSVGKLL